MSIKPINHIEIISTKGINDNTIEKVKILEEKERLETILWVVDNLTDYNNIGIKERNFFQIFEKDLDKINSML